MEHPNPVAARKLSSAQDVYHRLRGMITSLELAPASRITESQLADYFAVSRTPVRAALQKLENEGLLVIRPKQGCFIRSIDMNEIYQYYDVRVVIENLVLTEITKARNWGQLEKLAATWNPEHMNFGSEPNEALKQAEEDFHLQLAAISGNKVLQKYLQDITDNIRVIRRLGWPDNQSVMDTYQEHFLICDLLLKKDLPAAQAQMTTHIRKSEEQAKLVTLQQLHQRASFQHDLA